MPFTIPLPPTPVLETQRLILRPLRLEDAHLVQTHFAHWDIVRHLLPKVPWPYPEDGAETNIRDCLNRRNRGEALYWALTFKGGNDELIGRIDLRPDNGDKSMRGFWLAREHWGQGLMTEAAEAVTAYAFTTLNWPHLYVTNDIANLGSHRIKEKHGFERIDTVPEDVIEGAATKEVWLMTADRWRALSV